jgi:hypothetical protein
MAARSRSPRKRSAAAHMALPQDVLLRHVAPVLGPYSSRGISREFRDRFAADPSWCLLTEVPVNDSTRDCHPEQPLDLLGILSWASKFAATLLRDRRLGRMVTLRAGMVDGDRAHLPRRTRLETVIEGPSQISTTLWYTAPEGGAVLRAKSLRPGEITSLHYSLRGQDWDETTGRNTPPAALGALMQEAADAWTAELPRLLILGWETPSGARAFTRVRIAYKQRHYLPT